jgi:hypothetical protein
MSLRMVSFVAASILASALITDAAESRSNSEEFRFPMVPVATMTTGDLCDESDEDFDRYRYSEQIPYCKRNVDIRTKRQIYAAYGVPTYCRDSYTIDHFIPLSLGGSNQIENLWPEHRAVKTARYNLETQLYNALRAGEITQRQALKEIETAKWNPPFTVQQIVDVCYSAALEAPEPISPTQVN